MQIVLCDNHLLAAVKPAGVPSQPDSSGDPAFIDMGKEYVRARFQKPGNVYLALLHRLDRPTSGIVLMARTDKAAGRMAAQFRQRVPHKTYLAVVQCHRHPADEGRADNALRRRPNGGMETCAPDADGASPARLAWRVLARDPAAHTALLAVALETGVKHQIRCQLAALGFPVVGDFRYGPMGKPAHPVPVQDGRAILLHAARLSFPHPVRKEPVDLFAPPPDWWRPLVCEEIWNISRQMP